MAKNHSPGFLALVHDAKKRIRECTVADVNEKQRKKHPFVLVDVREDHEWNEGRLPGAVHLGRGILERDAEEKWPDKSAEIVLYCGGGFRSALAADNLQKLGFENVISMDGGIRAWKEAGLPIEKPSK